MISFFLSKRLCYWQLAGALALPGTETVLPPPNVIAPDPTVGFAPANILPHPVAPPLYVRSIKDSTFPLKTAFVPMVAELPTCHQTLEALAPPARMIWLPTNVVRVDPIWKMKTAFELPPASSVRLPSIPIEVSDAAL